MHKSELQIATLIAANGPKAGRSSTRRPINSSGVEEDYNFSFSHPIPLAFPLHFALGKTMLKYVEYGLSRLLVSAKGRDAGLFTKCAAFSKFSEPTFPLSCPEVGPSGSHMLLDHSADGKGRFPNLTWEGAPPETKELLLVSEDPDAPLSRPSVHGIYYGISPERTSTGERDFVAAQGPYTLQGGFKYGKNRRGNIYIAPRPMLGHGPHRYFFTIVALSQPVDTTHLSALPSIDEIAKEIEEKVLGWGEWIGVYERKWE